MKAQFSYPVGVAIGSDGAVYVADQSNHSIRKIQDGQVSTLAGTGTEGFRDGVGAQAQFDNPYGVAMGPNGTLYIADSGNHCIRKIQGDKVSTVVGKLSRGMIDGLGSDTCFSNPNGVAVGLDGTVYVADCNTHRIRKIQGNRVSSLAGCATLTEGYRDGNAQDAKFWYPLWHCSGPRRHCVRR